PSCARRRANGRSTTTTSRRCARARTSPTRNARDRAGDDRDVRRVLSLLIVALIVPSSAMASTVQVHHSAYGPVLFSGSGRALYLFTADGTRRSTCYGACARAWPPFYAKGPAVARGGARRGLLGTTRRRNC